MFRYTWTVFLLLLIGSGLPASAQTKFQIEQADETTLRVIGNFDKKTSAQLLDAILTAPEVNRLVITSGGGDVSHSIDVANLIHERGIALEVVDFCMSSCFNYFVLAASQVHIRQGALLGYHGTANTSRAPILSRLVPGNPIKRVRAKENEFLKRIGLPENVYESFEDEIIQFSEEHGVAPFPWMVGQEFFELNNVSLTEDSFFPQSYVELRDTLTAIENRYERIRNFSMSGDFDTRDR